MHGHYTDVSLMNFECPPLDKRAAPMGFVRDRLYALCVKNTSGEKYIT